MKKHFEKLIKAVLLFMMLILLTNVACVNTYAASKKTAKAAPKAKTEDEIALEQLTAYRDALVLFGASAEEIDKANKAIQLKQAQIQYAQTLATIVGDRQAILERGAAAPTTGVIFVGDSRFVQMSEAVGPTGVTFIAKGGKGYDWFEEEAIPRIDPLVVPGTKIVINLGVNDTHNIEKYIAAVNKWGAIWTMRGAKVYYATVNPVWDNPYTSKEQVLNFNSRLINGLFGINIIDTNTYLTLTGYRLTDGLHYDMPTNVNIYLYIMGSI